MSTTVRRRDPGSPPVAELLSQGDEVVTGQIADTNAAWLATRLTELGFHVSRHTTVGDRRDDLVAALGEIAGRADLCVGTGGLGPTEDDLTAECVATAFDRPLAMDADAMAQIEAMYARMSRRMPEVNRKQALLPRGSLRVDNSWGTAPGFAVDQQGCLFAFLPGVPREMKPMFDQRVLPLLHERFGLRPGRLVTLRTTGAGESDLQERIGTFAADDVVLGYRTISPENQIKLRFTADASDDRVRSVTARIAGLLGSPVFTIEGGGDIDGFDCAGGPVAEVVGRALVARGATLALAESCTGGRIASLCTEIPGSSAWLLEGMVTYSNAAKVRQLGVSQATLDAHGAVSEPVAREMAQGCRERSGATYGLSVTGVAGPGGGSPEKPVGTVHLALATPDETFHRQLRLGGDRLRIQSWSAGAALDLVRRHLQGHVVTP